MQVALEIVGEKGFVYGVDIEKVESFHKSNAEIIIADISKAKGRELILNKADGMLDAIISDIAPHTTGVKIADQAKSLELSKEAFRISKILLKESGNFLVKIFQGSDIKKFLEELKLNFREVKITKPEATRKGSAEVYIVGKGFMGNSKCIVNSE